jgi:raffinose/stachyose/melibiose transport system permease protein
MATQSTVRKRSSRQSLDGGYFLFLVPGILIFLIFIFIPFIANIVLSFTRWSGVGEIVWIGVANYQKAFTDAIFWASFRNNLLLIIAMTIIPTIGGLVLASFLFDYVAQKIGRRSANFFRAAFYLPQVIPIVIAAVVWRWLYQPEWGVINYILTAIGLESLASNWLGDAATALPAVMVVMIWFQLGYPLVIFMAGLQRIDPELYEAASLDGARWWHRFRHITVPLLRPEIYVVVLTTTISALKVFGPIYAMTSGGPGTATIVAAYFSYKNFFERAAVGYGATIATLLTVLILIITIFYVRVQIAQDAAENQ